MESIMAGIVPAHGELRPSERVIEAIASLEGREPFELDPPLFSAIDPDALDALFADVGSSVVGSVSFIYLGHEVVVGSDGTVRVDGR